MARKIQFDVSEEAKTPEVVAPAPAPSRAPSLSGMAKSLQAAAAASIREIETRLIDDSAFKDRIDPDAEEILDLADSIRAQGQLIPILVSPLPSGRRCREGLGGGRQLDCHPVAGRGQDTDLRRPAERRLQHLQGQRSDGRAQPRVRRRIRAAHFRGHGDFLGQLAEELGPLGVLGAFAEHDVLEFGMTRHRLCSTRVFLVFNLCGDPRAVLQTLGLPCLSQVSANDAERMLDMRKAA